MIGMIESVVEEAALAWLGDLGYAIAHGPDIAVGEPAAGRTDPGYHDVVLEARLRRVLARLNPTIPPEALEDAYRKLTRTDAPTLLDRNHALHRMLVDGVTVEYRRPDSSIAGAQIRVIDFDTPESNDWLAVNQFTVAEGPDKQGEGDPDDAGAGRGPLGNMGCGMTTRGSTPGRSMMTDSAGSTRRRLTTSTIH